MEPLNADSHLAFIAAGLKTCVSYVHERDGSVCFIDLDGINGGQPRRRLTTVLGYTREVDVARARLRVPVSSHPVDSVNLKDPRLGIFEELFELVGTHDVTKGRIRLELDSTERHAGLTVNEYETLLMRHHLAEVLRDPLRFAAEKGRHLLWIRFQFQPRHSTTRSTTWSGRSTSSSICWDSRNRSSSACSRGRSPCRPRASSG